MTRERLDKILEAVLSMLLGLMVLNVLWQVASRYLLNDPSIFTDELARYLLIWVGLVGAAYASGKHMHVSIALLERKLNDEQKKIQNKVIYVLVILFAVVVLIIGGSRLVYISFILGQQSSAMQIPLGYVYLALPLSGLLVCYYTIHDLLNADN
ncbi:TRAP transporter small permease [Reichenbachiella agarivorans]|uniref:TRAP transporter small permease n=1 Tax=Reichenbachiella agarivorans TaxID=2979464 RepID=A0ABY6CQG6_9BACT|nr:TRAP transporter small permease [Reichenbachiella agarivorans]UXP32763.1 TRAP transporter small permease [Reichenbachiella agarivorans]